MEGIKAEFIGDILNNDKLSFEEKTKAYAKLEKKFRRENAYHAIRYLGLSIIILFQTIVAR